MGAGAGVKVTSADFGRPKLRGNDLIVPVLDSYMEAYTWGVHCQQSGFIEFRDFMGKVRKLTANDIDYWGRTPLVEHENGVVYRLGSESVQGLDLSNLEIELGYEPRIDFVIGGGYIHSVLEAGQKIDISSEYGTNLGIDVWFLAKMKDDKRLLHPPEDLKYSASTTMYVSEDVYFHPSDRFVDMFNYCWDNWAEDEFDCEYVEESFNDDEWYKPNYDLKSRLKGIGKGKGKPKSKNGFVPFLKRR